MFARIKKRPFIGLAILTMVLLSACSIASSTHAKPALTQDQFQKLERMNRTAEEMYRKTLNGDITGALMALDTLSTQIPALSYEGIASVEGIHAFTECVTIAKRTFAAAEPNSQDLMFLSAQVRLAADALSHKEQPLWAQYYKVLQDDLTLFDKSVLAGDKKQSASAFNRFELHILTVKPSLQIVKAPNQLEALTSLMTYSRAQLNADVLQKQTVHAAAIRLKEMISELFGKKEEQTAFIPFGQPHTPIIWTLGVGTFIMGGLGVSAWQMFQRHNDIVSVRKKSGS